jgi:hypothetical protein
MLASMDVKVLPEGIVGALLQPISSYSRRSRSFLGCACVLQARLRIVLSSLIDVAAVVGSSQRILRRCHCYLTDALPSLMLLLFGWMLCRHVASGVAPLTPAG